MIIYDGDCAFCTRMTSEALERLPPGTAAVASSGLDDGELRDLGLSRADVATAVYWVDGDGRLHRGHRAVARILRGMGGRWGVLGMAVSVPPFSWLSAIGYRAAARWRHRLPGATDACAVTARPGEGTGATTGTAAS